MNIQKYLTKLEHFFKIKEKNEKMKIKKTNLEPKTNNKNKKKISQSSNQETFKKVSHMKKVETQQLDDGYKEAHDISVVIDKKNKTSLEELEDLLDNSPIPPEEQEIVEETLEEIENNKYQKPTHAKIFGYDECDIPGIEIDEDLKKRKLNLVSEDLKKRNKKSEDIFHINRKTLPGFGKPWVVKDVDMYKSASVIHTWSIEMVLSKLRQAKWTTLWGTTDERWVPNIVISNKNILAGVFVHTIWNGKDLTVMNEEILKRNMLWCMENNAIPMVCVMSVSGTLKSNVTTWKTLSQDHKFSISLATKSLLYDLLQEDSFDIKKYNNNQSVHLSDWELHEMAIRVTCDELENSGYKIERWNPDPSISPQIWATWQGMKYHILIQHHIYMEPIEEISKDLIYDAKTFAKQEKARLQAFRVTLANGHSTLTGETSEAICRGDDIDYRVEEIELKK